MNDPLICYDSYFKTYNIKYRSYFYAFFLHLVHQSYALSLCDKKKFSLI